MKLFFRNTWKTLRRYKVASALNILGLSIAFCVFTIIMIQVRYDLTYDAFHSKSERIFRAETRQMDPDRYSVTINRPLLRYIDETYPEVEATAFIVRRNLGLLATEDRSDHYANIGSTYLTTPDIFKVFDFEMVEGDMASFQSPGQLMIAESQAKAYFPGKQAVGQILKPHGNDSITYEVVAVYRDFPKNSYFHNRFFSPIGQENYNDTNNWNYDGFVLLSSARQQEKMEDEINRYIEENSTGLKDPRFENGLKVFRLNPIRNTHYSHDVTGDGVEKTNKGNIYSMMLIAILIIVIAIINFINFSMALVPARIRGINTRKVLGEPVNQMRWGQIFEAVIICLLSLLLSIAGIHFLAGSGLASLLSADISVLHNIPVLAGTLIIALVTGVVAGIFPAVYQSSFPPALVLKGSFGLSPRGRKMRTALISFQYIISLALIMVALFIREQNDYLRSFPIGIEKEHVLAGPVWADILERQDVFVEEVKRNPAIRDVAFSNNGLVVGEGGMQWGRSYKGEPISFPVIPVSRDFIPTLGLQVSEGRNFRESDQDKPSGALIFNRTAKEQFGLELNEMVDGGGEIVGFVDDFHFRPLHYEVGPLAFHFQDNPWYKFSAMAYFRVENQGIPATIDHIMEIIHRMDPVRAERTELKFFDEWLGNLYKKEERMGDLITVFSLLAVLISIMGVFGLVLFESQYRRKEIGVRRINGATVTQILQLLNKGFVRIVVVCFIVAVPIAWWFIVRWLEQYAYKSPLEWWIFAVSLFSVLLLTMLTVTLQSYRAATENPVNSLKTE